MANVDRYKRILHGLMLFEEQADALGYLGSWDLMLEDQDRENIRTLRRILAKAIIDAKDGEIEIERD
jgi:hypothetical protein